MDKSNKIEHLIIDIPEMSLDYNDKSWTENIKSEFEQLQNVFAPGKSGYSYYTWFWFFIKYGDFLFSEEAQRKIDEFGNIFEFMKKCLNLDTTSGGAYSIGYKFFKDFLLNKQDLDVCGIQFRRSIQGLKNTKVANETHQIIWYGAPGTGKSFEVNEKTKGYSVIRTTFHPDSDYSTFVGAYKPIMEEQESRVLPVVLGTGASFDTNKGTYKEKRIVYKFVKQAFLRAYLAAWQKYASGGDEAEPQFLVIEEINRGNCAQIFGDLFQLLDRENGFSKYPIEADIDLCKEIDYALNEETDANGAKGEYRLKSDIDIDYVIPDYKSAYDSTLSEDVQKGRVLLLPPNLYIWATMNTSDQSLFPIDSAFKRRWEWKYVKIGNGYQKEKGEFVRDKSGERIPLGWKIVGKDYERDWWEFVKAINNQISDVASSDDKKLGYFFCKPKEGKNIDEETFAGKVLFYLWNDVFKDNDTSIFIVQEGQKEASFDVFYSEDKITGKCHPNSANIKKFLCNVMDKAKKGENSNPTNSPNNDGDSDNSEEASTPKSE